jgi:hypothetical protein
VKYDVVLSGRITGNAGYREQFAKVAAFLRGRDAVARVFNPAELPEGKPEEWYMARCLRAVFRSKSVLMLPGWERSDGARAEHATAVKLGKVVLYF